MDLQQPEGSTISTLLVTANVGSIFEDPEQMLKVWTNEFLKTVAKLQPKFLALHCQEVGGKNYEKSMQHVENFVRLLLSSEEFKKFDRIRIYLDEDYSSAEHFTALGNFYFIHESLKEVLCWDFVDCQFVKVIGKEVHSGNIEAISTKEKAKFPQDFFPECKWSRKGFMRTRWSIDGTVFDLINIHLFHDASNFIAMEEFPSIYCKNRRRALEYTLNRFHNDRYGTVPFFVFGDFNFRTDTDAVVKKLTEGLTTLRVQNVEKNDHTKLQYRDEKSQLVLTVGKKEFTHSEHQSIFLSPEDSTWLRSLDREFESFEKQLFEYPIAFPPSYPFAESLKEGSTYMNTRCPSWCDRVLLSKTAKLLVSENSDHVNYNMMGIDTCMGDHKPVYLRLELLSNSGTIHCCSHNTRALDCSLFPTKCVCCSNAYASVTIEVTDFSDEMYINNSSSKFVDSIYIDKNLLHEPYTKEMLSHEPYTPESVESHSPMALDTDKDNYTFIQDDHDQFVEHNKPEKMSVSPDLLKSRLEDILRLEKGENVYVANDGKYEKNEKLRIKRCKSDFSPINENFLYERFRCMSDSTNRRPTRVRLKSTSSVQSCSRLEGHHSSSDEEWFEEVEIEVDDHETDDNRLSPVIENKSTTNDETIQEQPLLPKKQISKIDLIETDKHSKAAENNEKTGEKKRSCCRIL